MADTEPDEFAPILRGAGGSDYERYLRTDELLALQKGPDEWAHRDELLFQTVHQSSELWLKHAWVEAEDATRLVAAGDLAAANRFAAPLERVPALRRGLSRASRADAPWEYQEVRRVLGHGSGFDSPGFREIRRVSLAALRRVRGGAEGARALAPRRLRARPRARGAVPARGALTEWDERVGLWRYRHFQVVARIIGEDVVGTQGTPVELLAGLIKNRMFPELWARAYRAHRAREAIRLISLDEIRRGARADRERSHADAARAARCRRAVRDLAEARIAPADRLVQDSRRAVGRARGLVRGARGWRRHRERGQHGAGRGVGRAREAGVRARIVVPESAPRTKLDAVERLGGEIISVPHETWWQTMVDRRYEGVDGLFVHPVEDDAVMAGNGTIGLELVEDLPAFDAGRRAVGRRRLDDGDRERR